MSIWSEIRNDFSDDKGIIYIDAWISEDENEDGRSIALINPNGSVIYKDDRDKTDSYAQEMINEVLENFKQL
jgi:hypothetical protein